MWAQSGLADVGSNIARLSVVKNLGIDGPFELSQSYLFVRRSPASLLTLQAWDCIEKANWALELFIELADEPLDSRTMQVSCRCLPSTS